MTSADQEYVTALQALHERLADMMLVSGLALESPARAVRLRRTVEVQLRQLVATLHDDLKTIERDRTH